MMPTITITADPTQMSELQNTLAAWPKAADTVLRRAINRATARIQSRLVRDAARFVGIRASLLRSRAWKLKARRALVGKVRAGKIGWPLIDLNVRKTRKGQSVRMYGKRQVIEGAFFAVMPTGHAGIFRRKFYDQANPELRRKRLPIMELRTDSLTEIVRKAGILPQILSLGEATLAAEVSRQMELVLSQRQGAALAQQAAAEGFEMGVE